MVEPYPILFSSGSITVYSHGLLFALGAVASYFYASQAARRLEIEEGPLVWLVLLVFATGLASARIGFFVAYPARFTTVADLLSIWNGGLLSYAGMLGGGAASYALVRRWWPDLWRRMADVLALATLAGWGIGRVGNFLAGDSYGVRSDSWHSTYGRVPIQLFESASCLLIVTVGTVLLMRKRPYPGMIASATGAAYCVARTIIDVWRDEPSLVIGLKPSVVTAALLGVGLTYIFIRQATHASKI